MLQRCFGLMKNVVYPRERDKNEQITAETRQIMNMGPLLDEYYMKLLYLNCTFVPSLEPFKAFEVDKMSLLIRD